ncbi:hypothetical protein CC80DRAFT_544223 [Byssothecium circinans]|uniref:MYND-type zinc finger protein samB n=1 Tax=Byssothecium circinans TaxID=147558 RepID=A0A6A5U7I4_9PLEO|nr:hypothetical protein CC80DRAFT_544223 [Byssothecium circinans]
MAHPDFSLSLLQLIPGNTSEAHRDQDLSAHQEVCQNRRWLRDGERITDLCRGLFLASCKVMYQRVLTKVDKSSVHKLFFLPCTTPASGSVFYSPEVDEKDRVVALCLNSCLHTTQLGALMIAFMTAGRGYSNSLLHVYVRPKKKIEAWWDGGDQIKTEGYMHSINTDTWARDGIISDPSTDQFLYAGEHCSRGKHYRQKVKPNTASFRYRLGRFLAQHRQQLIRTGNDLTWERFQLLAQGATFRVVNNALWSELEREMRKISAKVKAALKEVRNKADHIDHVLQASVVEKMRMRKELMEQSDGEGHRELMEILDPYSKNYPTQSLTHNVRIPRFRPPIPDALFPAEICDLEPSKSMASSASATGVTHCELKACGKQLSATTYTCSRCAGVQVSDNSESTSILYCSETCRQADADTHSSDCEARRAQRTQFRVGIFLKDLFETIIVLVSQSVLKATWEQRGNTGITRDVYRVSRHKCIACPDCLRQWEEALARPFSEFHKKRAMYMDRCLLSIKILTKVIAFITMELGYKVFEIDVKPIIERPVHMIMYHKGKQILVDHAANHTVLAIVRSKYQTGNTVSLATATAIDMTHLQMGYAEAVTPWKDFRREKTMEAPHAVHRQGQTLESEYNGKLKDVENEMMVAINNVVYRVLEELHGCVAFFAESNSVEFSHGLERVKGELGKELFRVRTSWDAIKLGHCRLSKEKKKAAERNMRKQRDGPGNTRMEDSFRELGAYYDLRLGSG